MIEPVCNADMSLYLNARIGTPHDEGAIQVMDLGLRTHSTAFPPRVYAPHASQTHCL